MNTEDMLAIQQQVARYSYTFDAGDVEGWCDVFTDDAFWESYPMGATEPGQRLDGRAEIRAFIERHVARQKPGATSFHHQSGVIFDELTADTAKVRAMVIITVKPADKPDYIFMTGIYTDDWVKTPLGWRIKYRALRPRWQ